MYPIETLFDTLDKFGKLIHQKKEYEKLYYDCRMGKNKNRYAAYAKYCFYEYYNCKRYEISKVVFHGDIERIELKFGIGLPSEIYYDEFINKGSFICNSKNWKIRELEFDPILIDDIVNWLNLHIIMEI